MPVDIFSAFQQLRSKKENHARDESRTEKDSNLIGEIDQLEFESPYIEPKRLKKSKESANRCLNFLSLNTEHPLEPQVYRRLDEVLINDIQTDKWIKVNLRANIKSINQSCVTLSDTSGEIMALFSSSIAQKLEIGQTFVLRNCSVFRLYEFGDLCVNVIQDNIESVIQPVIFSEECE